MFKYLKLAVILLLIINIGVVFAEDNWITFPTANRKIYPIVFGKINDPSNLIDCTNNFTPSEFTPGQTPPLSLTSYCGRLQTPAVFFYVRNGPVDIIPIISPDYYTFYFITSNMKYNTDQNMSLVFPFRPS